LNFLFTFKTQSSVKKWENGSLLKLRELNTERRNSTISNINKYIGLVSRIKIVRIVTSPVS
jgi:hypothetical protein